MFLFVPVVSTYFSLVEPRQMLDVGGWDRFQRTPGLDPGFETARDDFRRAVHFFEFPSDAYAGGLAGAGAIEIDLALGRHELPQCLDLFAQPVGLDADGVFNALCGRVIVTVRADVSDDDNPVVRRRLHALVELFGGAAFDGAEVVLMQRSAEPPEPVEQDARGGGSRCEVAEALNPTDDDAEERREEKADRAPGSGVEEDAAAIQLEEAREAHVEAASQRSGDGAEAGDELGEEERARAAAVEGPSRAEDTLLRIETEAAEPAQQPPSGEPAAEVEDGVAGKGGARGAEDDQTEVQRAGVCGSAGGEENDGDGQRQAARGKQKDDRRRRISVVLHCDEQVHGPCVSPRSKSFRLDADVSSLVT